MPDHDDSVFEEATTNSMGLDTPEVQAVCRSVERLMRGRFGVSCGWVLRDFRTQQEAAETVEFITPQGPVHQVAGGPPKTTLEMTFQGGAEQLDEPAAGGDEEEPQSTEAKIIQGMSHQITRANAGRDQAVANLAKVKEAFEQKAADFEMYQAEEAALIRRLAAKTKATYGVDEPALLLGFSRWLVSNRGIRMAKILPGVIATFESLETQGQLETITPEMDELLEELVDDFGGFQKEPAGGMLPPSEGGNS